MYNGALENPLGKYESNVFNAANGTSYKLPFLVLQTALTALLGAQACQQIGLFASKKENYTASRIPKRWCGAHDIGVTVTDPVRRHNEKNWRHIQ